MKDKSLINLLYLWPHNENQIEKSGESYTSGYWNPPKWFHFQIFKIHYFILGWSFANLKKRPSTSQGMPCTLHPHSSITRITRMVKTSTHIFSVCACGAKNLRGILKRKMGISFFEIPDIIWAIPFSEMPHVVFFLMTPHEYVLDTCLGYHWKK